jgi:hypothetical protein
MVPLRVRLLALLILAGAGCIFHNFSIAVPCHTRGDKYMPKENAKMQSWRFFHYARKHLDRSTLYAIFGKRHARTVDLWCQDPRTTGKNEVAYDPIQGVRDLLTMLDDLGHCGVVRSCISYLVAGTSAECGIGTEFIEPKPTITEEILADYRAVAEMQKAIEAKLSPYEVREFKVLAIEELERTFAKYARDYE